MQPRPALGDIRTPRPPLSPVECSLSPHERKRKQDAVCDGVLAVGEESGKRERGVVRQKDVVYYTHVCWVLVSHEAVCLYVYGVRSNNQASALQPRPPPARALSAYNPPHVCLLAAPEASSSCTRTPYLPPAHASHAPTCQAAPTLGLPHTLKLCAHQSAPRSRPRGYSRGVAWACDWHACTCLLPQSASLFFSTHGPEQSRARIAMYIHVIRTRITRDGTA